MEEKLETIQTWLTLADEKIVVVQKLFDLGYFNDATSRAYYGMLYAAKAALLEKPGKPLYFRQRMKGQNLSFIISSIRLFFKKNPIER